MQIYQKFEEVDARLKALEEKLAALAKPEVKAQPVKEPTTQQPQPKQIYRAAKD